MEMLSPPGSRKQRMEKEYPKPITNSLPASSKTARPPLLSLCFRNRQEEKTGLDETEVGAFVLPAFQVSRQDGMRLNSGSAT